MIQRPSKRIADQLRSLVDQVTNGITDDTYKVEYTKDGSGRHIFITNETDGDLSGVFVASVFSFCQAYGMLYYIDAYTDYDKGLFGARIVIH